MTQNEMVLEFIKEHGSITQRDAIKFGCYRLSARIADLKAQGIRIDSLPTTVTKADGTKTRISVYRLRR